MVKVGHPVGLKLSSDHKAKIGEGLTRAYREGRKKLPQEGEKAPHWKGDKAKPASVYSRVHRWMERQKGKPLKCENCNKEAKNTRQAHWANISGEYLYDVTDWIRLCPRCHKTFDRGGI